MSGTGGGGGIIIHTPVKGSTLGETILTDLHAGESWLVSEAESAGTFLWNTLKAAFIALAPAEMAIVKDLLTGVVADAAGGKSIEQMEGDALNTATDEQKAVLAKAGSGVVQVILAGIKANPVATI